MAPAHPNQYGALLGCALTVRMSEVVDVWDLLTDVTRFIRSWRPMRNRPDHAQLAVARLLEEWDRLGKAVR